MSDEIRREDEVEAHGAVFGAADAAADTFVETGAMAAADDEEPDVEAHGAVGMGPTAGGPTAGGPTAGGPTAG